jgi:hypothetical protein
MTYNYNLLYHVLSYFISASVAEVLWAYLLYHDRFNGIYWQFITSHNEISEENDYLMYPEEFYDM